MMKKRILLWTLLCGLIFAVAPCAKAVDVTTEGTCGTDVVWRFEHETLTIECDGAAEAHSGVVNKSGDWAALADRVRAVRLTGAITAIDKSALSSLTALECAIFETPSLASIGSNAFAAAAPIRKAYFVGTQNDAFDGYAFAETCAKVYLDSAELLCHVTVKEYEKAEIVTDALPYEKTGSEVRVAAVPKAGYRLKNAGVIGGTKVTEYRRTIGDAAELQFTLDENTAAEAAGLFDETAHGVCGDHAFWYLYGDGTLLVTGFGDITTNTQGNYPWSSLNTNITAVIIDNGITNAPSNSFRGYSALREVRIGSGVTGIGDRAFADDSRLERVEFLGDKPELGLNLFRNSGYGAFMAVYHEGHDGWPDSEQAEGWKFAPLIDGSGVEYELMMAEAVFGDSDFCDLELVDGKYRNSQGIVFDLKNNNEAWVVGGYAGSMGGEAWIPDTVRYNGQDYDVLVISVNYADGSKGAFANNKTLRKLHLGKNIGEISAGAFFGCANFESFEVAEGNASFKSMDGILFSYNGTKLCIVPAGKQADSYTVPSGVTDIITGAFNGCTGIKKIVVDGVCNNIMTKAFENATGLESVEIRTAENLSIGADAFKKATSLASVSICDSVVLIGKNVFNGCKALQNLKIPFIGPSKEEGKPISYLGDVSALRTLRVSGGVLADDVFSAAAELESIYIAVDPSAELEPGTVRLGATAGVLGDRAFVNCTKIARFVVDKGNQHYQTDAAAALYTKGFQALVCFPPASEAAEYSVNSAAVEVRTHAFDHCTYLEKLTVGNGVSAMGEAVFCGCSALTELVIPFVGTSRETGSSLVGMFDGSSAVPVQQLRVADGELVENAFADKCTVLASIHLGDTSAYEPGVVKIGKKFASIGAGAFRGCVQIARFVVNKNNVSFDTDDRNALYTENYKALICFPPASPAEAYRVKSSTTEIKADAFAYCANLTELTIGDKVESMGRQLFKGCDHLTSLTVPFVGTTESSGIKLVRLFGNGTVPVVTLRVSRGVLADYAFDNADGKCGALQSINIGDASASEPGKVKIGAEIGRIGAYAFRNCTNIGRFVVDKGNSAYDSDFLGALYTEGFGEMLCYPPASDVSFYRVKDAASKVWDDAFYNCRKLATVYITKNVSTITTGVMTECPASFWVNQGSTAETALGGKTVVMRIEEKKPNSIQLYHLTDVLAYESGKEPENYEDLLFTANFEGTTILLSDSDFNYALSGTGAGIQTVTATYGLSDGGDASQWQFSFRIAMLDVPQGHVIVERELESSLVSEERPFIVLAALYRNDGKMLGAYSGLVIDNVNDPDCNVLKCAFCVPSQYLENGPGVINKLFIIEPETLIPVREPITFEEK